jgi:hypothetical protein
MTTTQELELFLHRQGAKPQTLVATPGETLRNALRRTGAIREGGDEILVFVGEFEEALMEPPDAEDGEDRHEPVDIDLTIEVLAIEHHQHIHCHTCRRIAMDVAFNGKTKRHRFSPSATVATATKWARKKFRLDPAAAADYVLESCGTTEKPRPDKHLGELVRTGTCSLCFDLVKEVTPQG